METNTDLELARQIIERTDSHLFLTGRAGTGKTTFLRSVAERARKRMVVLAPTGIAAINAGGQTIHSFFQINPHLPYIAGTCAKEVRQMRKAKLNLIRSLEMIVIDEVSMVRADLMDNIDERLRIIRRDNRPFGGVQLLMIGDLQQLSPVVKPEEWAAMATRYETQFFYSSHALQQSSYLSVELKKIYRQADGVFINLLNKVRDGKMDNAAIAELNRRHIPNFEDAENRYIRLVTHNRQADEINFSRLKAIDNQEFTYTAEVEGTFPEASFPTEREISLKIGAQVMFVKNDPDHRFVNGSLAQITALDDDFITARLTETGDEIEVGRLEWSNVSYTLNADTQEITENVVGAFRQIPVRLAWAITIHKSQGLTFERAIIDAAESFTHGQTYVALSRCKTLDGLVLASPIPQKAIISSAEIQQYTERLSERTPDEAALARLSRAFFAKEITALFDFLELKKSLSWYKKFIVENFAKTYPAGTTELSERTADFGEKVAEVGEKFQRQISVIISESTDYETSEKLQERMQKAAAYFLPEIENAAKIVRQNEFLSDNKELSKRTNLYRGDFLEAARLKISLLKYIENQEFVFSEFLHTKAKLLAGESVKIEKIEKAEKEEKKIAVPSDIQNRDLYEILREWRAGIASEKAIPPYCILANNAIMSISNALPESEKEFVKLPYCGKTTFEKYGAEILEIVAKWKAENGVGAKKLEFEGEKKDENFSEEKSEEISYMEKQKQLHKNAYAKWTEEDDENLTKLFKDGKTDNEIAEILERNSGSIKSRLKKMGLERDAKKEPTREISLRMFNEGKTIAEIANERELAESTIWGHLRDCFDAGKLPLNALVSDEKITKIKAFFAENPIALDCDFETLKTLYTIETEPNWNEVLLVRKVFRNENSQNEN